MDIILGLFWEHLHQVISYSPRRRGRSSSIFRRHLLMAFCKRFIFVVIQFDDDDDDDECDDANDGSKREEKRERDLKGVTTLV